MKLLRDTVVRWFNKWINKKIHEYLGIKINLKGDNNIIVIGNF